MPSPAKLSDTDRAAIVEEMQHILDDPNFSSSLHCARLLRYLTEHVLDGDCEGLKERTLGIEVFGRDSDYDTSADPVVRTTASQIRRRLARYYQKQDPFRTVRIRLEVGHYLPEFDFEDLNQSQANERDKETTGQEHEPVGLIKRAQTLLVMPLRCKWTCLCIAAALMAFAIVLLMVFPNLFQPTSYLIWKPLLDSKGDLIVCIADTALVTDGTGSANVQSEPPHLGFTSISDSAAAYEIGNRLYRFGRPSQLRGYSDVTLKDVRSGPIILVGAGADSWIPRLLSGLRYSIHYDPSTSERWIQDSQHPSHEWNVMGSSSSISVDYAVITRLQSSETGEWIMVLAGLRATGTKAACDLITDDSLKGLLPASLRSQKNFQIVLKTIVVNRFAGRPQVLAVHVW